MHPPNNSKLIVAGSGAYMPSELITVQTMLLL